MKKGTFRAHAGSNDPDLSAHARRLIRVIAVRLSNLDTT